MLIELLPSSAQRTLCPAGSGCGDGECELLPRGPDVARCAGEPTRSTCPFNPSSHFPSSTQSLVLPSPPCPTAGSRGSSTPCACCSPTRAAGALLLAALHLRQQAARQGLSPLCTRGPGGAGGGEGGPTEGAASSAEETGERGNGEGMGMDGGEWGGVSVVVKTHEWAEGWEVGEWSGVVLLTERDVCGVADSYLRVGWLPHSMPLSHPACRESPSMPRIKAHMQAYLRDHQRWKQHAAAVIPLASIVPPGSPSELLCLSPPRCNSWGSSPMEGKAEGTAEGAADGKGKGLGLRRVWAVWGEGGLVGGQWTCVACQEPLLSCQFPQVRPFALLSVLRRRLAIQEESCGLKASPLLMLSAPLPSLIMLPSPLYALPCPPTSPPLVGHPPPDPPPTLTAGWAPDPVTKLWPRHKGAAHASKGGAARGLTGEERAELQQFEESLAPAASESTEQCA
ncbi:unnamed protein product [Closterium sp. NIES-64]|nr:unnamed protein product [Closterium sp. NIES-64]